MEEFDKISHRQKVGSKINQIRINKGMTIQEVSDITGLDKSNICKIEKGKYNVSIDILGKVCKALESEIVIKEVNT